MRSILKTFALLMLSAASFTVFADTKSILQKMPNQCVVDYKVSYEYNDVPDWSIPPKGFCSGENMAAIPASISVFPLSYKMGPKNLDKSQAMDHEKAWFYVIWHCYAPCAKAPEVK